MIIKEGIQLERIYYEVGAEEELYMVKEVAYHLELDSPIVIFNRCDKKGLYLSLRKVVGGKEVITPQPFFRGVSIFKKTFRLWQN